MRLYTLFALLTLSAPAAKADDVKVGYVDMNRCINEVEDGKRAKDGLKTDFDKKQGKLETLKNELKNQKDEFDKKAAMMKPDVKEQKQGDMQRKAMELQETYMQLQKELIDRETQLTQDIAKKVRTIVERIGDRDGYFLVLDSQTGVLYFKRHMDITDDVITEYNRQYAKK